MPQINFDLTANNDDKVLSKRCPTAAVMTMQKELPGGLTLANGEHTIGFIEGNVTITKVALVVRDGFNGTTPLVTVTEVQGGTTETWLTDEDIAVTGTVSESGLTAPVVTGKQAPFYRSTKGEWKATIAGADDSTKGNIAVLIDYVQMDAEPGLHS